MPGGGNFCLFSRPGGRSFALKKAVSGVRILTEKISGPGGQPRGDGNRSN